MQDKQPRGFTLIELLVVIAIIGILASIILVSLNTARAKGRDSKRMAELTQMVRAIVIHPSADTSTAFAGTGCTAAGYNPVSNCTSPDLSQFNDPSNVATACGASPVAACDYTVSDKLGTGAPLFNNWQIKTWLEGPTGAFSTGGEVCVSSATSTPYQLNCN